MTAVHRNQHNTVNQLYFNFLKCILKSYFVSVTKEAPFLWLIILGAGSMHRWIKQKLDST